MVKGQSIIRKDDRLIIIPDKQQVKHAWTGYDLLYNLMIPGIDVDRRAGTVKTLGGNVTLYINGRKTDYREVQNLRPRDIVRVEFWDVPIGEFAGDVASINYITRPQTTGGYVSMDADQTIGYLKGNYNVAAKVMKENTSYTLYGGHQMQRHDGQETVSEELFHFTENDVARNYETTDGNVKNNSSMSSSMYLTRMRNVFCQAIFRGCGAHHPRISMPAV